MDDITKSNLVDIYKVEADKYNKTRDIQWRLNLAVWTLFALGLSSKDRLEIDNCYEALAAFALFIVHAVFIWQIHNSLDRSIHRMKNLSEAMLGGKSIAWKEVEKPTANIGQSWRPLQIAITAILMIVFMMANS